MMGTEERNFQPLPEDISLDDLVAQDNFYRRLQQKLDLSFVRALVEDRYAACGRPSVDPEVFFLNPSRECLLRGSTPELLRLRQGEVRLSPGSRKHGRDPPDPYHNQPEIHGAL